MVTVAAVFDRNFWKWHKIALFFFIVSLNRSRSSQSSHRYDGYSSDTGAFDSRAFTDEVDYRRPLHVQTPNRPNERYHTITKTTTVTNERPFVSVKRAHEQSKANNNIIGVSVFISRESHAFRKSLLGDSNAIHCIRCLYVNHMLVVM